MTNKERVEFEALKQKVDDLSRPRSDYQTNFSRTMQECCKPKPRAEEDEYEWVDTGIHPIRVKRGSLNKYQRWMLTW